MARDLGFTHSTLKMAGGFQPYPPTWLFIPDAPPQPVAQILGSLIRLLIPAVIIPFAQYSWPVPAQPTPRLGFTSANLNSTLLVPGQAPFSQNDWPNPRSPARSIDGLSWVSEGLDSTALSVPFKQTYWPNPIIGGRGQGSTSQGLNLTELLIPFAQHDWPNPLSPLARSGFANLSLNFKILLFPFNQTNWPNPPQVQPRQSHTDQLKVNLLGQDAMVVGVQRLPERIAPLVVPFAFTSTNLNLTLFVPPPPVGPKAYFGASRRPSYDIETLRWGFIQALPQKVFDFILETPPREQPEAVQSMPATVEPVLAKAAVAPPEPLPAPIPQDVIVTWEPLTGYARSRVTQIHLDMQPVYREKRKIAAKYAKAALEHDKKLIRDYLAKKGKT